MSGHEWEAEPDAGSAARETVLLLERAQRLAVVFRRLFWVAAAGLGLTGVAVVCGDWEAAPGWWVGWALAGQGWMVAAALWALRVYRQMETLEQAARGAPAGAPAGTERTR